MIKINKAKCLKCGDVIESKHIHDWVSCTCGNIFVDGGRQYLRRGVADVEYYQDLSEATKDEYG